MNRRNTSFILSWHMTKQFLLPFVCAILGFTALFLLNNFFDDIGDFIAQNVSGKIICLYLFALQPQNLIHVIPISILLASSFMTMMMGRHNELTAIRATGLSIFSTAIPIWCIAILASFGIFAISESWGPASTRAAEQIEKTYVKHNKVKHTPFAFASTTYHRDWSGASFLNENTIQTPTIVQYAPDGTAEWILVAQEMSFENQSWTAKSGMKQTYQSPSVTYFDELSLNFEETPRDLQENSKDRTLATVTELRHILNSPLARSEKIQQEVKTLLWYKFVSPLVCIIAALFGVSLTMATDRVGLMKGFAYAVGMLVLYYLVSQGFLVCGKNGWFPPFVSGALPTLLFLGIGIGIMKKKQ